MKIVFNKDTKRFQDFQNYQDLVASTFKAFQIVNSGKDYKFYYVDQEGDIISITGRKNFVGKFRITSQEDFNEASSLFPTGKLKLILTDSYQVANQALTNMFDQSFSTISQNIRSSGTGFQTERVVTTTTIPNFEARGNATPETQAKLDHDKIFDILNTTTVSLEPEPKSEEFQKVECYKCDGTKFIKKGTKPCKKCKSQGFFKTQFKGDLKSLISCEVKKIMQNREFKEQMTQKIEKMKSEHKGYTCDSCNLSIFGIRYKCSKREDYDLCEKCEFKMVSDLPYPMWKIREPKHMAVSIMCQYAEPIVLKQTKEVSDEPPIVSQEYKDMISDLQAFQQENKVTKNMKVSELADSDLSKIKYMQDLDAIDLSEDFRVKMIQLMNMGLLDFNSNLIALFEASGLLDVACSQIMKNEGKGGVEE